ncbi:MAG: hypothetical protein QXU27_02360, partial [Candidatus Anstonellales archaeon]
SSNQFCILFNNDTICSNTSYTLGNYNIQEINIDSYNGQAILVNNTIPDSYLYWYNRSSYQFLGNCTAVSISHNILNSIPYEKDVNNNLFRLILNYSKSPIKYIKSNQDIDPVGICDEILVLDKTSSINSRELLIVSDYSMNPGKIGLNVISANLSIPIQYHITKKPDIKVESEARIDGRNINSYEISLGLASLMAIYTKAIKQFRDVQLIVPYIILASRGCNNICENTSVNNIRDYNHITFYSYRNTRNDVFVESDFYGAYVFYNPNNTISSDHPSSSNIKNVILGSLDRGNFSISLYWNHNYDDNIYMVYKNINFKSVVSNRSLYKGYIEGVLLELINNHPDSYMFVEGVSIEAWNESGKVADLYSRALELPINAMGKYYLPITFYIPENIPDSYLKIKIFRKHVLEGYPIIDQSKEGWSRTIMQILGLNISDYLPVSIYKVNLPYYGFLGYNLNYIDIDAYTKLNCRMVDEYLNQITTGIRNSNGSYIYLICNSSTPRKIYLFDSLDITFKNITAPPVLPIEIIPLDPIYTNNVNKIRFKIINRMLYSVDANMLMVRLFNSTDHFDILLGNNQQISPGEGIYYTQIYIPNVTYTNYSIIVNSFIESDMVGRSSVLDTNYNDLLPVQRLRYGMNHWIKLWKDNLTTISFSIRRPATLCGDEVSQNGMVRLIINGIPYDNRGNRVMCECSYTTCYYFYDSSYSDYVDYGLTNGLNEIYYTLYIDYGRINRLDDSNEPTFPEALRIRMNRLYGSENSAPIIKYPFDVITDVSIQNPIQSDVYLSEGFVNVLRGNITNKLVFPLKLKYLEVLQNGVIINYKKYDRYILPNETFNYNIALIGTIQDTDDLQVNYVFEHEFKPGYFIRPIPKVNSICESILLGPYECQIDDPEFLRTYMNYYTNLENWSVSGQMIGSKNYVFRTQILIPYNQMIGLGIYTNGITELYVSSPKNPQGYSLDRNLVPGTYRYYPGYMFNDDRIVISGRIDSSAAEIYLKLLINYTDRIRYRNVPNLRILPIESYYYTYNNVLYNLILNRNPINQNIISVVRDRNSGVIYYTESILALPDSKRIVIIPIKNITMNILNGSCNSNIYNSINTHLGRLASCYGSIFSNISGIRSGYSSYVVWISNDYQGKINDMEFNISRLTWENNITKIVLLPIYSDDNYL